MNLFQRRRNIMSAKKDILPAEYREVEWIEAKYGPAINTGIWLSLDTEISMVGQQMETQMEYLMAYGCTQPNLAITYSGTSNVYSSFGSVYDAIGGNKVWTNTFHEFKQNKNGWWLDDVLQISYKATIVQENTSRFIALFGRTSSGNVVERKSWWKIKYFIIRKNGVEVCHLIPCYRKQDGEIGMYDIIQKVFRTNIGSGNFSKGDNV